MINNNYYYQVVHSGLLKMMDAGRMALLECHQERHEQHGANNKHNGHHSTTWNG